MLFINALKQQIMGGFMESKKVIFDQRDQIVNYQYNAAGDINIGAVQNRMEAVGQLEKILAELGKATQAGAISGDVAVEAEYQLKKAVQLAQKPEADKKTLLEHLSKAKSFVENVAATGGLVSALIKAGEMVQRVF
jgi:hypothetical protein